MKNVNRSLMSFMAILVMGFACIQCGGGGGGSSSGNSSGTSGDGTTADYPRFSSTDNEITEFIFPVAKNSSLTADVKGEISGTSISCYVPHNTDITSLVAEYVTNSSRIEVDGTRQTSDSTVNDFSGSRVYRVYASDSTYRDYTVAVTKAPDTSKEIKSFSLAGVDGSIDTGKYTISVTLPSGSKVTSLAAKFSFVGKSISSGGNDQVSGVSLNDFSSPVSYTVTAEDGSTQAYTVTVTVELSQLKSITSFTFESSLNAGIAADVTGKIDGETIALTLPYGTSKSALIATFVSTGKSVTASSNSVSSGVSSLDYSSPVVYRVTAEDGSYTDYTVNVSVALNSAKQLLTFSLDGEKGSIDSSAGTVSLTLASTRSLENLIASFTTSGTAVYANSTLQTSGLSLNSFVNPVSYTVTAEDGTTRDYTVTVSKSTSTVGLWNFEDSFDSGVVSYKAEKTSGIEGSALQFSSSSASYVYIPYTSALDLSESGSVEVLFNASTIPFCAGIIHKGIKNDFSDESYSLQFWDNNKIRISLFNQSGSWLWVETADTFSVNKWYHVVATWDKDKVCLYVNGKLSNYAVNAIGAIRCSTSGVVIGAQLTTSYYNSTYKNLGFNGIIDRVVLENTALSADDVSSRYAQLVSDTGSSLTAYMPRIGNVNTGILLSVILVLGISVFILRFIQRRRAIRS